VWHEPRPSPTRARAWWDWALVALLVPTALLEGIFRPDVIARPLSIVVTVGLVPTLLWRRSRPLLMVAVAFGVCLVSPLVAGSGFPNQYVFVYLVLLPFSLFRWGAGWEMVVGAAIMLSKITLSWIFENLTAADAIGGFGVLVLAMALGAAFRYRNRARTRELDQVKLLERERLARDLHDTVAHHVSAMAIRAQAGIATSTADPDAALDALKIIDAEAARALDEMRGIVRILRTEQPVDLSPNPRVVDIERLASTAVPSVVVEISGNVEDLPSPVGAAIYRLAQEAVTNARRHARHATRVDVRVEADNDAVRLSVRDDGDTPTTGSAPGFGLVGMTERAGLLGGTCAAGPNPDRGWTVTAVLPRVTT
jgi:signal transduction histidine kinase